MSTPKETQRAIEDHKKWLGYLQPDGLVVSAAALVDKGHYYNQAQRERQLAFFEHLSTHQTYDEEEGTVAITDLKALAIEFLGLPAQEWIEATELGEELTVHLAESREVLAPSAALRWPRGKEFTEDEPLYQALVWEHPGAPTQKDGKKSEKPFDFDTPYEVVENTWSTTATLRFERLLRENNIPIGLLVSHSALRLVYAPVGENAGHLTFHFADMLGTMGRPILGAFDLLFNREMLFLGEESHQLPTLLKRSREMQANVSIELAQQVLNGLYDLVRGTQAADARSHGHLLREILATNPNHIYEGQLNVLMRLVFLLFAEDRGLMPNSDLYNQHYSVHALYERLRQDAALHNENMDDRYGAWAQLLSLFRLVFHGHRHKDLSLPARYGYLFDPDRFPFLEGNIPGGEDDENTLPLIPDGTLFRVLQGLLFLNGERISYRTLDVEQIGSVYETMMGFSLVQAEGNTIAIRPQKKHGAAANLNLDHLLTLDKKGRAKFYTEVSGRKLFTGERRKQFDEATCVDELVAVLQSANPNSNSNLIARNATPQRCAPGSLLLQPTDARRKSGSHYTPRKLTEPIVRKALEPVLANLTADRICDVTEKSKVIDSQPQRGETPQPGASPRENAPHKSASPEGAKQSSPKPIPFPKQILDLKVCDPAVGSGAFLVEACRQLGDELVKSWAAHGGKPVIPQDEDEVLHARRLVAQRCLYGVDRNPMAADLAKLSLWLATLAKDHPFTFLAHAIRSGDSLVGLGKKQILAFHWDLKHASAKQRVFGQDQLEKRIKSALAYRQEILDAGDLVLPEMKAAQLRLAEEAVNQVRRAGDLAVLGFFSGSKTNERQEARDRLLERWLKATDGSGLEESIREGIALKNEIRQARNTEKPVAPFHWEIEFPEVFERKPSGFDCFVGNPPFLGGARIWAAFGVSYPDWLRNLHPNSGGKGVDLVAHFFRRAFTHLRNAGCFGLIASKTICQGDTRSAGLREICLNGGSLYSATKRFRWPGEAAVIVSVIHCSKNNLIKNPEIDGRPVKGINSFLFNISNELDVAKLQSNKKLAFRGSDPYGKGFIFSDQPDPRHAGTIADMHKILEENPSNQARVFPFIGGQEVVTSPSHEPFRFAINFERLPLDQAQRWPDLLEIVRLKVKPERDKLGGYTVAEKRRELWWHYGTFSSALHDAIQDQSKVLVISRHTTYILFAFLPSRIIFSDKAVVFPAYNGFRDFVPLNSRVHELWALFWGTTLGDTPVYSSPDCFETFPLPTNRKTNEHFEIVGREYYDYRAELMLRNDEGLTKTYNRFHDPGETSPDIHKLRELHAAMDRAVLDAYGWTDVPTDCEFIPDFTEEDDDGNEIPKNIRYRWPDEVRDDVLARLLALNAERYQAELNAGLHSKSKSKKPKKKAAKKTAKKRSIIELTPDLPNVSKPALPAWAASIGEWQYPLPSGKRINAEVSSKYYRSLIVALVQEAGGRLPTESLYQTVTRLENRQEIKKLCEGVPDKTFHRWLNTFDEDLCPDAFGSALESAVQMANDVRLVGTSNGYELRSVRDEVVTLKWYLLDAQLLLNAQAHAEAKNNSTAELPEDLKTKIIPFAKSA